MLPNAARRCFKSHLGAVIDPVGIQNRSAQRKGPAAAQTVTQGHIEQVDLIFLLRILCDALRLFDIPHKMSEGILPAMAETDGPFARGRCAGENPATSASSTVRGGFATATAKGAK